MADRDKDLESRSVEAFLWVHRSLTNMVKATPHMPLGEKRFTPEQYTRERQALDRQVWALTHNARLYVIHPETFHRIASANAAKIIPRQAQSVTGLVSKSPTLYISVNVRSESSSTPWA